MSKNKVLAELTVSLTKAIDQWLDEECQNDDWEKLDSFVGQDLCRQMATAAMAVLAGVVDVQEYMRENNV